MTQVRRVLVTSMALALGVALTTAAVAQNSQGPRRGFGGGASRGSLLGLLRLEEVQKELKLSEENAAKVTEIREKLGGEMREKFTALREMDDREQRRKKATELSDEYDRKAREQLHAVLPREQMIRLYQIRLQVRPVMDGLANGYVAGKLELTDEQKTKLADLAKDEQAKRSELFSGMRDASEEQRREAFAKYRKNRADADEKALGLLSAEQKEAFEKMKGEKFELPSRRGRR